MRPRAANESGERDALSRVSGVIANRIHSQRGQQGEPPHLRRPLRSHLIGRARKRLQSTFNPKPTASRLSRFPRSTVASFSKALVVVGVASFFPFGVSAGLGSTAGGDTAGLTDIQFPGKGITISVNDRNLGPKPKQPSCTVYQFPRRKAYSVGNATSEITAGAAATAPPSSLSSSSSSPSTRDVNASGKPKLHIRGILHSLVPVSSQPHLAKLPASFQVAIEDGQGHRQDVSFKRDILVKKNDIVAPLKNEGLKVKDTAARRSPPISLSVPSPLQAKSLAPEAFISEVSSTPSKREKGSLSSEDAVLWTPPKRENLDDGPSSSIANISHLASNSASTQPANAAKPAEMALAVARHPAAGALVPAEGVQQAPMFCAVPVSGVYGHLYPIEEAVTSSPLGWTPTPANSTQTVGNDPPTPPPPSSSVLPWQIVTVVLGVVSGVALVVGFVSGNRPSKRNPCDQLLPNLVLCRHDIHVCDCRDCSACARNNACTCPCHPSVVAVDGLPSPPITREVHFELVPK